MNPADLSVVNARVRTVAERIQPLLEPHPGLAQRNAHAHAWLGLKVTFGDEWRVRTAPESVHAFLDWMEANPNSDYGDYPGPRRELSAEARGELF